MAPSLQYEFWNRHGRPHGDLGQYIGYFDRLLKQLNPEARGMTVEYLSDVIASSDLLVVIDTTAGDRIVGMTTLCPIISADGPKGSVQAVITEEEYRGQGIGREMIELIIDKARMRKYGSLEFTSHPSREAANKLYIEMGFELRDTNCYRMKL